MNAESAVDKGGKNPVRMIALVVVVVLVYAGSAHYPASRWDDQFLSMNQSRFSPSIANAAHWFSHTAIGCYVPAAMLSHMIDEALWDLSPVGCRLQNLFWHVVAALFLYKILERLRVESGVAWTLALVFAVHPQRVESVVWLSERKDVMCAAFYLMTMFLYLRAVETGKSTWPTIIPFILALLSKPMAVSLPVVLFLLEFRRRRSFDPRPPARRLWPHILLAVTFAAVGFLAQDVRVEDVSPLRQSLVVIHNVFWYLEQSLLPIELNPMYPELFPRAAPFVRVGVGAAVVLGAGIAFWMSSRRTALFEALPLTGCYLAALAPVSGVVQAGAIDYADRYSYIPSAFVWLGVGLIVTQYFKRGGEGESLWRRGWLGGLAGVYVCCLVIMNVAHAASWGSTYALYRAAADGDPANGVALWKLGQLEIERDDWAAVTRLARRLRQGRFRRKFLDIHEIRGIFLEATASTRMGRPRRALELFERIERSPNADVIVDAEPCGTKMSAMMAECHLRLGDVDAAVGRYRRVSRRFPDDEFERHFYAGLALFLDGRCRNAAERFGRALEIRPGDPRAERNRRLALAGIAKEEGRVQE